MQDKEPKPGVGKRIQDLREALGVRQRGRKLTQPELGKLVGKSRSAVASWEGDAQLPTGPNLLKLADVLETTPEYILYGTEFSNDAPPSAQANEDGRTRDPDVSAELDRIDALEADEWLKVWRIAETAALYRSVAMQEAETAARIRAEAMRLMEQNRGTQIRVVAAHDERVPPHIIKGYELPGGEDGAGEREEQTDQEADD